MEFKHFSFICDSEKEKKIRNALVGATSLNQDIQLFDFGNVMVQKTYMESETVNIVIGGPYYMGDFVGLGMATCAIHGTDLAAPPPNAILRTLHELSYKNVDSLIIITKDPAVNLNFGLAIERAIHDNLNPILLTLDDQFDEFKQYDLKSTLSGIILLFKIAGAMSEDRRTLTEIFEYCKRYCSEIISVEVKLPKAPNSCICYDDETSQNAKNNKMDKNKSAYNSIASIHFPLGNLISLATDEDPDNFRVKYQKDNEGKLNLKPSESIIILINNNLALTKTEEYFYVREILVFLRRMPIQVDRFYVGNFLPLCASGISITLMKVLDTDVLEYLDAPCKAPAWNRVVDDLMGPVSLDVLIPVTVKKIRSPEFKFIGPQLSEVAISILTFAMQFACKALISCEYQMNIMDAERDDGDTGTRIKTLVEVILKQMKLNQMMIKYPFNFFKSIRKFLEKNIGGVTGALYTILFDAISTFFEKRDETEKVEALMWFEAFESAREALKRYGNVEVGDGTMYDPMYAFCESAKEEFKQEDVDTLTAFGTSVLQAEKTVEKTKKGYSYPDPGAYAVGVWMRAIYEAVKIKLQLS